eukprot:CAMPEP_0170594326 /NCGR_PEP_ID=MMETSP0224-20130122/13937_1 /TAXON_ID=285029 /ORGANISM="Togula jolla, Strain CCCM 725" /LENGTH=115 /DNA_ID=CAMNT_0010918369 /DNA_START=188 /DNA_END=535 /DNA_ORIENTATION=-
MLWTCEGDNSKALSSEWHSNEKPLPVQSGGDSMASATPWELHVSSRQISPLESSSDQRGLPPPCLSPFARPVCPPSLCQMLSVLAIWVHRACPAQKPPSWECARNSAKGPSPACS